MSAKDKYSVSITDQQVDNLFIVTSYCEYNFRVKAIYLSIYYKSIYYKDKYSVSITIQQVDPLQC